jgi:hypothetical protein
MIERIPDRRFTVWQTLDWRVGVQNARADRQILKNEIFAGRNNARRAVAIDVDNRLVRFSS